LDQLGVFEAIYSNRQITAYKPDPVPLELIVKVIEAGTKAGSGGNRQPWEFIIINDQALVRHLGELYRESWMEGFGTTPGHDESDDPRNPQRPAAIRQARRMAENMTDVPVMILVCADHSRSMGPYDPNAPIVRGREATSILMAVQNIFLAARAVGLGTRYTGAASRREAELRQLLDIPPYLEPMVLIPMGYPKGGFGPTNRRPVEEVVSLNKFGTRLGAVAR
jgi:nitroreductase